MRRQQPLCLGDRTVTPGFGSTWGGKVCTAWPRIIISPLLTQGTCKFHATYLTSQTHHPQAMDHYNPILLGSTDSCRKLTKLQHFDTRIAYNLRQLWHRAVSSKALSLALTAADLFSGNSIHWKAALQLKSEEYFSWHSIPAMGTVNQGKGQSSSLIKD